jgi:hypothetical protein
MIKYYRVNGIIRNQVPDYEDGDGSRNGGFFGPFDVADGPERILLKYLPLP